MEKQFEYINHLDDIANVQSVLVIGKEDAVQDPLVSVIMPVYNHPDFFKKSLLSVVNQKCDFNYEIVIVDNKHPELQPLNQKIIEEVNCDKVRYYINSENIGGVGSENRGVQLAKGKYITYCHDDDMLTEKALQVLIDWAKQLNNDTCAIFGNITTIDENDNPIPRYDEWMSFFLSKKKYYPVSMYDFLQKNYTNGCGSLYNRESLLEMGGFNSDYIPCPDYALNVKYTSIYGAYAIREITLNYRVSQQSDSSTAYKYQIDAGKKIQDSLLKSGYINSLFPNLLIKSNQACRYYHLYSQWAERPSDMSFYFYRIINRCWLSFSQLIKMIK